jgi:hypothetical protein
MFTYICIRKWTKLYIVFFRFPIFPKDLVPMSPLFFSGNKRGFNKFVVGSHNGALRYNTLHYNIIVHIKVVNFLITTEEDATKNP